MNASIVQYSSHFPVASSQIFSNFNKPFSIIRKMTEFGFDAKIDITLFLDEWRKVTKNHRLLQNKMGTARNKSSVNHKTEKIRWDICNPIWRSRSPKSIHFMRVESMPCKENYCGKRLKRIEHPVLGFSFLQDLPQDEICFIISSNILQQDKKQWIIEIRIIKMKKWFPEK